MKQGKSLTELAQALMDTKAASKDFIVPTEILRASAAENNRLDLKFGGKTYEPTSWAHSQLSGYTKIPKAYYDRLNQENPDLLADCVNHSLVTSEDQSRLIRTVNGNVRAVLSSRYRILDSHDMLESVFPLFEEKGLQVVSSELTEQRMFIKVLSPRLTADIKKGDAVQYGLTISSSDVGSGSVKVEPLIYRLVCMNGMISNTAFRKFHVGKNQHEDSIQELLSDRTKAVSDAAFWMQVTDIIKHSLQPENFEAQVDRLRVASGLKIESFNLPKVVEVAAKTLGITGETKVNSILAALASGNQDAGLTQWGLINSFTAAAKDDRFSYEESIELERAGGSIIELSKKEWSTISEAA
jgi:hypothetical protein